MSTPILATKLYIPPSRAELVPRPHLLERLNGGLQHKLILISAPAGYGKTTLVSNYLHQLTERREHETDALQTGWISFDEDDNSAQQFFSYLSAAISHIPDINYTIQTLLQATKKPAERALALAWLNDLSGTQGPIVLVLEDLHTIPDQAIYDALAYILDHLPPQVHLIITTRIDPIIPLSRLRARGQMIEIRIDDLRFSPDEATDFFQKFMKLPLSPEQISALEQRTEGWIAGLQLVALSMQGLTNEAAREAFVANFTGSHRYIFDYLADEVLSQQSLEIQAFLLQTSVLDQFCGSLCDQILDGETTTPSQHILEQLESANLFIIPLDDERRWYRYHHLFAMLLEQRLQGQQPDHIPQLYLRASQWYEAQGQFETAIQYALKADDGHRAANLLDEICLTLNANSEIAKLINLANQVPKKFREAYPRLCVILAFAYVFADNQDQVDPLLTLAETYLKQPDTLPASFPASHLQSYITLVRAYAISHWGQHREAITIAKQALTQLPEDDLKTQQSLRASFSLNMGIAYRLLGQATEAKPLLESAVSDNRAAGRMFGLLASVGHLMQVHILQAELHKAEALGQQGLRWLADVPQAKQHQRRIFPVEAEVRSQLTLICYEWNDLEAAQAHLDRNFELCQPIDAARAMIRCYTLQFYLYQAQGNLSEALACHNLIQQYLTTPGLPHMDRFEALSVQRLLLLNRLQSGSAELSSTVTQWADDMHHRLNKELADDQVTTFGEDHAVEIQTLVCVWLRQMQFIQAHSLIEKLCRSAEAGTQTGNLIRYLALYAIVLQSLDQQREAQQTLSRSLALAESAGYVRTFADIGSPLLPILQQCPSTAYQSNLINAIGQPDETASPATSSSILIEPLSNRELDVLRLLSSHLSGPEIADTLIISPNTLKTHTRNIYGKLDVRSRSEAVDRARRLHLI